jgi:hypothetical protein
MYQFFSSVTEFVLPAADVSSEGGGGGGGLIFSGQDFGGHAG